MTAPELFADASISAQDLGAKLGTWNSLIRRARIGRQRKQAALTLSSYADENGRDIKCGIARLAVDCEIGYSTARRYVAWLRQVGLIELVRAGNRKARRADEYRLIIGPEVYQRLEVPEMDDYRKLVDEVSDSNRVAQKVRRLGHQRSPEMSADSREAVEPSALTVLSAEPSHQRSLSTPSALALDEPLPSSDHLPLGTAPSTGGTLPPDPLRPPPPSGPGTVNENSLSDSLTPAQGQQGESLPPARAANVIPFTARPAEPHRRAREQGRAERAAKAEAARVALEARFATRQETS